jgi:hypothetical protein
MSATIISNAAPFGALSNQMVAELYDINDRITRLQGAIAGASSGYTGTAGTEYEGTGNNFGVLASSAPGAKGSDFAFAVGTISAAWTTFWGAASGSISALDNGVVS